MVNRIDTSDLSAPTDGKIDTSDLTPTGLPSINKPTFESASPSNEILDSIPGVGLISQLSRHPAIRRAVLEGAGMQIGAMPGEAMTAAGVATGNPLLVVGGVATASAGAGVGNTISGKISDIEDNPETSKKVFNFLFQSNPQQAQTIIGAFQKDPEGTTQQIVDELKQAGIRFSFGAAQQLLTMGLRSLVPGAQGDMIKSGMGLAREAEYLRIPGREESLNNMGLQTDPSMYTRSRIASLAKAMMNNTQAGQEILQKNTKVLSDATKNLTTDMAGGMSEYIPSSDIAASLINQKEKLGQVIQDAHEDALYGRMDRMIATKSAEIEPPGETVIGSRSTNKITTLENVNMDEEAAGVSPRTKNIEKTDQITAENKPNVTRKTNTTIEGSPGKIEENTDVTTSRQDPAYPGAQMQGGKYMAPGVPVSTQPIQDFVDNLVPTSKMGRFIRIGENIRDQGPYISLQTAQKMRSDFGMMMKSAKDGVELGTAKAGYAVMSKAMEDAAKGAGPDVYNAWKAADAFTSEGKQIFSNDVTAKWMMSEPLSAEKLGGQLVDNGTVAHVQELRKVAERVQDLVENPEYAVTRAKLIESNPDLQKMIDKGEYTADAIMNKEKKGVLQNLFAGYSTPAPDTLAGEKVNYQGVLAELDPHFNPKGYGVYKELWGEQGLEKLKEAMTNGFQAIQKQPAAYDRAMLWAGRIITGAVGTHVLGVGFLGGEGAYLLSEKYLASALLTNPNSEKLFTQGLKALASDTALNTAGRAVGQGGAKTGIDLIIKAATTYANDQMTNKENQ